VLLRLTKVGKVATITQPFFWNMFSIAWIFWILWIPIPVESTKSRKSTQSSTSLLFQEVGLVQVARARVGESMDLDDFLYRKNWQEVAKLERLRPFFSHKIANAKIFFCKKR
jgi:hypothetical protein